MHVALASQTTPGSLRRIFVASSARKVLLGSIKDGLLLLGSAAVSLELDTFTSTKISKTTWSRTNCSRLERQLPRHYVPRITTLPTIASLFLWGVYGLPLE
jgi:hypothetical protein